MTLLDDIASYPWNVAARTYGSNHATLIGLGVHWWINGAPQRRWALDGGPAFASGANERGQCDAIFGEDEISKGVLEVESTRYEHSHRKIGNFFAGMHQDLTRLEFGIFFAFQQGPTGRGDARCMPELPVEEFVNTAVEITREHQGKDLLIATLQKRWERHRTGPRARNQYYEPSLHQVTGILVRDGRVQDRRLLFGD